VDVIEVLELWAVIMEVAGHLLLLRIDQLLAMVLARDAAAGRAIGVQLLEKSNLLLWR